MKLLTMKDLPTKGIKYHPSTIWQMVKDGQFPKPVRLSANRIAWVEEEIDAHIQAKIKQRDAQDAQSAPTGRARHVQKAGN